MAWRINWSRDRWRYMTSERSNSWPQYA